MKTSSLISLAAFICGTTALATGGIFESTTKDSIMHRDTPTKASVLLFPSPTATDAGVVAKYKEYIEDCVAGVQNATEAALEKYKMRFPNATVGDKNFIVWADQYDLGYTSSRLACRNAGDAYVQATREAKVSDESTSKAFQVTSLTDQEPSPTSISFISSTTATSAKEASSSPASFNAGGSPQSIPLESGLWLLIPPAIYMYLMA